jgi:Putative restriction endonuclease
MVHGRYRAYVSPTCGRIRQNHTCCIVSAVAKTSFGTLSNRLSVLLSHNLIVWISQARRATALGPEGHLHAAPELVVEVLSPGGANERRDREAKLKLYSRRGVLEYWIVDWRTQQIEVFRREQLALRLVVTLYPTDTLTSPLLPGFMCQVATLFSASAAALHRGTTHTSEAFVLFGRQVVHL